MPTVAATRETLQRLLDDHLEVNAAVADEGDGVTVPSSLPGRFKHAERDIAALDGEQQTLLGSEIGQLFYRRRSRFTGRPAICWASSKASFARAHRRCSVTGLEFVERPGECPWKIKLNRACSIFLPAALWALHSVRSSIFARGRRDAANFVFKLWNYQRGVAEYNAGRFTEGAASFSQAADTG